MGYSHPSTLLRMSLSSDEGHVELSSMLDTPDEIINSEKILRRK